MTLIFSLIETLAQISEFTELVFFLLAVVAGVNLIFNIKKWLWDVDGIA